MHDKIIESLEKNGFNLIEKNGKNKLINNNTTYEYISNDVIEFVIKYEGMYEECICQYNFSTKTFSLIHKNINVHRPIAWIDDKSYYIQSEEMSHILQFIDILGNKDDISYEDEGIKITLFKNGDWVTTIDPYSYDFISYVSSKNLYYYNIFEDIDDENYISTEYTYEELESYLFQLNTTGSFSFVQYIFNIIKSSIQKIG